MAWIRRKNGSLRKKFVCVTKYLCVYDLSKVEVKDEEESVLYRPVGYIRVAVAGYSRRYYRFLIF